MSHVPPALTPNQHRFWIPVLILLLAAGAMVGLPYVPTETLDEGTRNSLIIAVVALAALLVALWYLSLSGFSWTTRIVGPAAALGLVVAAMPAPGGGLLIRRIEFNGFMQVRLEFVWQDDPEELLDEYLKKQAKTRESPAADSTLPGELADADYMSEYRGKKRDGIVPGEPLSETWGEGQPKELWKHPVGGGYASFAVDGNRAFTIEQRRENEAVVCYDIPSGVEIWAHEYPGRFEETLGGLGPRSTPTFHDGRLYSLGALGSLRCLNAADGTLVWAKDIFEVNGSKNLQWGMSGSPLVVDGKVIVTPGSQGGSTDSGAVLAFDATTGELLRKGTGPQGSYASPMLAELLGVRQILVFDAAGLAGYDPDQLDELWRFEWKSQFDINAAQPVVVDDHTVFITSNVGCALIELTQNDGSWTATPKWKDITLKADYSNAILQDGHVYGLDKGYLTCVKLADGKRAWKGKNKYGNGQMLLRGKLLVIISESEARLSLVRATPEKFEPLHSIPVFEEFKTWNCPVLSGNRLLLRNHVQMAGFELPFAELSLAADASP